MKPLRKFLLSFSMGFLLVGLASSLNVWAQDPTNSAPILSSPPAPDAMVVKVSEAAPGAPISLSAAGEGGKDQACLKCHSETKPLTLYSTKHGVRGDTRTPFCISCHGGSETHLKDKKTPPDVNFKKGSFAESDIKTKNGSCLTCHSKDSTRHNWAGSAHQIADVSCTSCHSVHSLHDKVQDKKTQSDVCFTCHKEQRTEMQKISHHPINEGKMSCSDCHNAHGATGPKMLKKNTLNDTCYTCHTEKRGPFLWEHLPVSENCNSCHSVHGSNVAPLLKSRSPFMCQSCHDGPHSSKSPRAGSAAGNQGGLTGVPSEGSTGRSCMNCHNLVHGSNHPAGALLQR